MLRLSTSRVLTPKRLYSTFPTKLAEWFLNKAALLFGDFEGFCLNFKVIFCILYLSNFPFSNPEKIAQKILYQVGREVFE